MTTRALVFMSLLSLAGGAALPGGAAFAAEPAACAGKTGQTGELSLELVSGGMVRTYRLHVPAKYNAASPTPLVLNFHGVGGTAAEQEAYTQFSPKSDEEGFIVAYPDGYQNSWNAGWCCAPATTDNIDDVQFSRDLVAAISQDYCIDADRVFATGFSNGGFMSHRLACEASDLFAAVAPASGVIAINDCAPTRAVPVIQTHGRQDTIVPYKEGLESNQWWAGHNVCSDTTTVVYKVGSATCYQYNGCPNNSSVEWCMVRGMGHDWPATDRGDDIDATDTFWDFFTQHPFQR